MKSNMMKKAIFRNTLITEFFRTSKRNNNLRKEDIFRCGESPKRISESLVQEEKEDYHEMFTIDGPSTNANNNNNNNMMFMVGESTQESTIPNHQNIQTDE